jgi:hypothetical protein
MSDGIAFGASDAWLVGTEGTILHYQGGAFSGVTGATPGAEFVSIDGPTTSDLYLLSVATPTIGEMLAPPPAPRLFHWDGTHASAVAGVPFDTRVPADVFAASDSNVWIVGSAGLVLHWDGGSWTTLDPLVSSNLTTVWGRGAEVWVGSATEWAHWNGTSFSERGTASIRDLGGSPSHVWGVGSSGIFEWVSPTFVSRVGASPGGGFASVAVASDTFAYFLTSPGGSSQSQLYDGSSIRNARNPGCNVYGRAFAAGPNDVWLVSHTNDTCEIMRGDPSPSGAGFAPQVSAATPALYSALVPVDHGLLYGAMGTTLYRGDGHTFTPVTSGIGTPRDVSGSSASDVWVTDAAGHAAHYDGTSWTMTTIALGQAPTAVASTSNVEAWAGSGSTLYHWSGGTWSSIHTAAGAISVVSVVGTDLWIRASSAVEHYDGSGWTTATPPSACTTSSSAPLASSRFTPAPNGDVWLTYAERVCRFHSGTWAPITPAFTCATIGCDYETSAYGDEVWATDDFNVSRWLGDRWDTSYAGAMSANVRILPLGPANELWVTREIPQALLRRSLP